MKNLGAYKKVLKRDLSSQEKTELIEKYANLVKIMAYRLIGRLPASHFVEDLISCGTIGLLEAIEAFDPTLNIKFETFAKFRVRGAMIDEMRSRDWIPRSVRSKIRELDSLHRKVSSQLGRVPNDNDMSKALGMDLEHYYNYIVDLQPAGMMSYEDIGGSDMPEKSIIDFLEDRTSPHPDLEVQMKELKSRIIESLEQLDQDEQLAMALYYYEGLTLKEIAEVLQVTESRVSQIHSKALMKLHWRLDQYKNDFKENV
ncbi:MAG: FliA/WhiG family RNA polymerase sigma factor [Deltaproteobacteria bacterium]|nr:FliA/WhiG family RNA polymerase sigma factor [Deltaproteobacteria bacterium]